MADEEPINNCPYCGKTPVLSGEDSVWCECKMHAPLKVHQNAFVWDKLDKQTQELCKYKSELSLYKAQLARLRKALNSILYLCNPTDEEESQLCRKAKEALGSDKEKEDKDCPICDGEGEIVCPSHYL